VGSAGMGKATASLCERNANEGNLPAGKKLGNPSVPDFVYWTNALISNAVTY